MDREFLKGLLKLLLGGILLFGGMVILLYNFAMGFEISLAFLSLLSMLAGALLVVFTLFPRRP
jgi:hypothetical protein